MFFAYSAIANQIANIIQVQPGEGSFGNAYCGLPLSSAYGGPSILGQINVSYASVSEQIVPGLGAPDILSYGQLQQNCSYISNTIISQNEFRNIDALPNALLGINCKYITNTNIEANLYQNFPPNFVIPANIDIYPIVFCAKIADGQLPLFLALLSTSIGLISNTRLELDAIAYFIFISRLELGLIIEPKAIINNEPIAMFNDIILLNNLQQAIFKPNIYYQDTNEPIAKSNDALATQTVKAGYTILNVTSIET